MATPTLGLLNATEINDADTNTGWTAFTSLDADLVKEGLYSLGGVLRSDGSSGYYDSGTAPATAVGKTVRLWFNTINLPFMEVEANGGYEFFMYDGTATQYRTVFGSDTYFGGWVNIILSCDLFTTLTLANVRRWGIRVQHTGNAANKTNCWIDVIRYLDGYYVTGGTSGDPVLLSNIASADRGTTTLYGYGIVNEIEGLYICTGTFQIGNGSTTTYFSMDGGVLYFSDQDVAAGLYSIEGNGSGCNISIVNSVLGSSGTATNTRFVIDMATGSPASVTITGSVIRRASTVTFASGQTITGNTFLDCGQITPGGADMTGSSVSGYEGTADTAALVYNVAADPDGELDDMEFTKGTASTHAIEFGTSSPTTMTLRGVAFSGYNATDAQTDSTLYFARTSGTVTVYLVGCSGNISYKSAGAAVVLIQDPVTVKVTAATATGTKLQGVNVFVRASDGTGPFPFEETVTIVNSGTTATVTHTGHGMATGDKVNIEGASLTANNGCFQITVTGTDTYTYTMASSPGSSPTGTITSTFVALYGTTDVNGEISMSRVFPTDQPVIGWARKASSAPYYKSGIVSGTISSSTGLNSTVVMILDQ